LGGLATKAELLMDELALMIRFPFRTGEAFPFRDRFFSSLAEACLFDCLDPSSCCTFRTGGVLATSSSESGEEEEELEDELEVCPPLGEPKKV
jgi:hypothetical protein